MVTNYKCDNYPTLTKYAQSGAKAGLITGLVTAPTKFVKGFLDAATAAINLGQKGVGLALALLAFATAAGGGGAYLFSKALSDTFSKEDYKYSELMAAEYQNLKRLQREYEKEKKRRERQG